MAEWTWQEFLEWLDGCCCRQELPPGSCVEGLVVAAHPGVVTVRLYTGQAVRAILAPGSFPRPGTRVQVCPDGVRHVDQRTLHQPRRPTFTPDDTPFIPAVPGWDSPQRPGDWGALYAPRTDQDTFTHDPLTPQPAPPSAAPPFPFITTSFQTADGHTHPITANRRTLTPTRAARWTDTRTLIQPGSDGATYRSWLDSTHPTERLAAEGFGTWLPSVNTTHPDPQIVNTFGLFRTPPLYGRLGLNGIDSGPGVPTVHVQGVNRQQIGLDVTQTTTEQVIHSHLTVTGDLTTDVLASGPPRRTGGTRVRYDVAIDGVTATLRIAGSQEPVPRGEYRALTLWASVPALARPTPDFPEQAYWVQLGDWLPPIPGRDYPPPEHLLGGLPFAQELAFGTLDPPADPLPLPDEPPTWVSPDGAATATIRTGPSGPVRTLTASGVTLTGGTWAAVATPHGPAYLHEQEGTVTRVDVNGTVSRCSRTQFETDVLRVPAGDFQAFSPTGQGAHDWPPDWAWVTLNGGRAAAVTAWHPWRDLPLPDWPGRPRRRPPDTAPTPPGALRAQPPLGVTLATTAPPPHAEESRRQGEPPWRLPGTAERLRNGAWQPDPPALKALTKPALHPPSGTPEQLDDRFSTRAPPGGPLRVTFTGPPFTGTPDGRVALLLRVRLTDPDVLPDVTVNGQVAALSLLGRNITRRGWQPALAVTTLPLLADAPLPALTLTATAPLARALLTRTAAPPTDGGGGDPGGGGNT